MSTDYFQIRGGTPLHGQVVVSGNKNAILPMLAATLLTDEPVTLTNVPDIRDVHAMCDILTALGASVTQERDAFTIHAANLTAHELGPELCGPIRTSFLVTGPLLARLGRAILHPPGGDGIGRRRLDAHFYGLQKLGASVDPTAFDFQANALTGADLFFDEASVTATEHILMTATLAKGETVIRNAAAEPHVQNLAAMLQAMGALIDGVGTNTLTVQGVERLHGATVAVQGDHIEAGSFLAAAAATGGSITVHGTSKPHFWMTRRVFEKFGIQLELRGDAVFLPPSELTIQPDAGGMIPRVDDGPWPQFPSDLMSVMLVLATQAQGTVLFFEKMFESRMYFVDRLIQMGASAIVCDPHRAVISGPTQLRAQSMTSPDIRAGLALVIAALSATGTSQIHNAWVIDRGYQAVEEKLRGIGADIRRCQTT